MSVTNALTAEAATRPAPPRTHALTLLGIFTGPDEARALIRTERGATLTLTEGQTQDGFTLQDTGDGWALVRQGRSIHRLVIA